MAVVVNGNTSGVGTSGSSSVPIFVATISATGPGTYIPQAATKWLRVTLVGGGGGGGSANVSSVIGNGGSAGGNAVFWIQNTAPSYSYSVGVGGNAGVNTGSQLGQPGQNGGGTVFGNFSVSGGYGAYGTYGTNGGGAHAQSAGYGMGYGCGGPPAAAGSSGFIMVEEY